MYLLRNQPAADQQRRQQIGPRGELFKVGDARLACKAVAAVTTFVRGGAYHLGAIRAGFAAGDEAASRAHIGAGFQCSEAMRAIGHGVVFRRLGCHNVKAG